MIEELLAILLLCGVLGVVGCLAGKIRTRRRGRDLIKDQHWFKH